MSNAKPTTSVRHSLLDRMRGPMTLLLIGVAGFALYYSLFFERKTSYYRERNARLTARVADQIRRSIGSTRRIVDDAAGVDPAELDALYKYDRTLSDEQRQPQAIFDSISVAEDPDGTHADRGVARLESATGRLIFESKSKAPAAAEGKPANGKPPVKRYVTAVTPLQRLLNTVVGHTAGDVFDTVFILDLGGNVIYQSLRRTEEDGEADIRIVRLRELRAPKLFEKEGTLQVSDLMTASRQMAVRIGDANYQLFSVPLRSGIETDSDAPKPAAPPDAAKAPVKDDPGVPPGTWVVCGVVSNAAFRTSSLAMSATVLSCLAAVVLLTFFCWPFAKMALASAQHKVTLADVILLGVSGILATAMVCLIVLDWFTFRKLEDTADQQLERLAADITRNVEVEIGTVMSQLDEVQAWAEEQVYAGKAAGRNVNLLDSFRPERGAPYFQSVSLISRDGMQKQKWSVDKTVPPLIRVSTRRYYSAPLQGASDYLSLGGRRITIQSVRSLSNGEPDLVFGRRTAHSALPARPGRERLRTEYPVIALSVPDALSVIGPVLPEDFGFAIVDGNGQVLFHSQPDRNTVENFFTETDKNPKVRAAVEARQKGWMNIRYWGDDYRAYVQPMRELPWTLITFRDKQGLRTLNTEALITTAIFLLGLVGAGLLFLTLVLLLKPRYRAAWVWPDPARVSAYVELIAVYLVLLVAGAVLLLALKDAALVAFPFWFVPLVLALTYLGLKFRLNGFKRIVFVALAAICTACLLVLLWRGRSGGWSDLTLLFAAILLLGAGTRVVLRRDETATVPEQNRARRTALPLCYTAAAFLLLFLVSAVPTAAFFKASYELEVLTHVKGLQMRLARDLENRWWRVSWEFDDERGKGKQAFREQRWQESRDRYTAAAYDTNAWLCEPQLVDTRTAVSGKIFPDLVEAMLPRYSDASVKTRELMHDRAADGLWLWTRDGARLDLEMRSPVPLRRFTISSVIPPLLPSLATLRLRDVTGATAAAAAVALLLILVVAFVVSRFIARRVFLVDLVHPLWLAQGFLGLRNVICHPCDEAAARRLFRDFRRIDLSQQAELDALRAAPQSFDDFETAVFIDGLTYAFATGEKSELLRELIERLTRNGDRTVVLRPTALTVITTSFLQGKDHEAWGKVLSGFVWVNGSQLVASARKLTFNGTQPVPDLGDITDSRKRWRWRSLRGLYVLSGFDAYFEQFTDSRRVIERTLARETEADPYLETIMMGLGTQASGRDQLLDEISERAEEYYTALWRTCSPNEQLVMMQISQTGLVNGKARKDVRRLLARGLLRRDPQLRLMNETYRRFVLAQCTSSELAQQLEQDLAGDAWSRFRVPFFAAIAVVMLFFFTTQRQTFDTTIALIGGLAASLPAFLKTVSGFRGGAKSA